MKISSYDIQSNSRHQYQQNYETSTKLVGNIPGNRVKPNSQLGFMRNTDTSLSFAAKNKYRSSSFSQMDKAIEISRSTKKAASQAADKQLVSRLVSHATKGKVSFTQEDIMANIRSSNTLGQGLLPSTGGLKISAMRTETLHQIESTVVNTQGIIETQDGRQIKFGMHLSMEREFMSKKTSLGEISTRQLIDPLVIQFDDGAPSLSDKIFSFDLNGDGNKENIHGLGKGSGFLAFDANEDGQINDGTELFGTKSGNGFADLAKYDEDGNGWIDENDSIFNKLSVWRPEVDGQKGYSKGLLDSNVGAIFLGQTQSNHSITDAKGNTKGVIKSTGMFLKETGETGHVFQMDLAKIENPNKLSPKQSEIQKQIKTPKEDSKKEKFAIIQNLMTKINTSMLTQYSLFESKQDSISDINDKMRERMDKLLSMLLFTPRISQVA